MAGFYSPETGFFDGPAYEQMDPAVIESFRDQAKASAEASEVAHQASQNSANASAASALEARQSEHNAAASAATATTQAGAAFTKANEAATSAVASAGSASASASSASTATAQAGIATTQAGHATTKAGEAAASATASANSSAASAGSATTSSTKADQATSSAAAAAVSAANSANSATASANSATSATAQAGIATVKAGEAAGSATASAGSATSASTSAGTAAAKAGEAASSASAASTSAANAATSASGALNSLKAFRGVYYGSLVSDPSADPDGSSCNAGDLYWNSSLGQLRVFNGTVWVIYNPLAGAPSSVEYLVRTPDSTLTAERVVTDTSSIVWDWTSAGVARATTVNTKNYILNGAMIISQENGSTAGTTSGYYPVDQFQMAFSSAGVISSARIASPTPSGSPNRLRVTVTTADAVVSGSKFVEIQHSLEGLRVADLKAGTASPKTVTIKFGVRAPAGVRSVVIRNSSTERSYVAEYTISAAEANIDVIKSVTLTLDNTGSWAKDNTRGMVVSWTLMAGPTLQGASGVWLNGNYVSSASQSNFMETAGNTFDLFDVGLYEGRAAPDFVITDDTEECRRYCEMAAGGGFYAGTALGASLYLPFYFTPKRGVPSCALRTPLTNMCWSASGGDLTPTQATPVATSETGGRFDVFSSSLMSGVKGFRVFVSSRLW
jgi:hypothetical protein